MITRYSKKYGDIAQIKANFLSENDRLLQNTMRAASLYKKQDERKFCKICGGLQNCSSFTNHGIKFLVCNHCGHINGSYEETHEFTEGIYEKRGVSETHDVNCITC